MCVGLVLKQVCRLRLRSRRRVKLLLGLLAEVVDVVSDSLLLASVDKDDGDVWWYIIMVMGTLNGWVVIFAKLGLLGSFFKIADRKASWNGFHLDAYSLPSVSEALTDYMPSVILVNGLELTSWQARFSMYMNAVRCGTVFLIYLAGIILGIIEVECCELCSAPVLIPFAMALPVGVPLAMSILNILEIFDKTMLEFGIVFLIMCYGVVSFFVIWLGVDEAYGQRSVNFYTFFGGAIVLCMTGFAPVAASLVILSMVSRGRFITFFEFCCGCKPNDHEDSDDEDDNKVVELSVQRNKNRELRRSNSKRSKKKNKKKSPPATRGAVPVADPHGLTPKQKKRRSKKKKKKRSRRYDHDEYDIDDDVHVDIQQDEMPEPAQQRDHRSPKKKKWRRPRKQ